MTNTKVELEEYTEEAVHNVDGICMEESCSKDYTRSTVVSVSKGDKRMKLFIPLCEEHAKKFEEIMN